MDDTMNVEQMLNEQAAADLAAPDGGTADVPVTGNETSLAEVLGMETGSEDSASDASETVPSGQKEPGYVQKRIDKALKKQAEEMNAQFNARLEAELAPFREERFERQADELVRSGDFKSRELALEYVKLKGGVSPVQEKPASNGQNTPANGGEEAAKAKAQELYNQAKAIKRYTGVDVMAIYNNDPSVKENILSGKWDFDDVYNFSKGRTAPDTDDGDSTGRRAPAAVRSSNGVNLGGVNISKMSHSQFAKIDEFLEQGGKIDMRS